MLRKKQIRSKKNVQKQFVIKRIWIYIILIALVFSFFIKIWPMIFIGMFCVANAILLSIDRYINAPVDLEISTFTSILMTLVYGLNYGLITAFFTKFADMIYNKRFKMTYFFMISGYVVAALFANLFSGLSVIALGIIVTFLSNIYLAIVRKFLIQYSFFEILAYGGSNFIFNMVLFIGFSEPIYTLMKFF